jgi:hypothetical protein
MKGGHGEHIGWCTRYFAKKFRRIWLWIITAGIVFVVIPITSRLGRGKKIFIAVKASQQRTC